MCKHKQRKESQQNGRWGMKCLNCGKFYPYKWSLPYTNFPSLKDDLEELSYA